MSQEQRCFVCKAWGTAALTPIYVSGGTGESNGLVAQCPRCFRWLCNLHSEPLRERGAAEHRSRQSNLLVLGCPFDPDVMLGSRDT
jgi:hypothetical protein